MMVEVFKRLAMRRADVYQHGNGIETIAVLPGGGKEGYKVTITLTVCITMYPQCIPEITRLEVKEVKLKTVQSVYSV